ncbi:MAG: DNA-binding protein WhiA [Lachnospiraceae bacterium]|jgi:DNA-binding protein WhiA|nr:DNA-binding protein WhiA [Lachnospiraceae bacterium]
MSFSSKVKDELADHVSKARHCRIAELAAILAGCAKIRFSPPEIEVQSENVAVVKKVFILLQKIFGIQPSVSYRKGRKGSKVQQYGVCLQEPAQVWRVLTDLCFLKEKEGVLSFQTFLPEEMLQRLCCHKAYIRGAFLAGGSINDPQKNYHIEFLHEEKAQAELLQRLLRSFEIESRILERTRPSKKMVYVLYLKNGEQIVDLLSVMKAHVSLMELENVRIVKDVRNKINRQVNCETANLNKTIGAAVKQIEDIRYLMDHGMFQQLPPELLEMAQVRLENEDLPLKELGRLLNPPVSKSGVNHRLRRLSEMAQELREKI